MSNGLPDTTKHLFWGDDLQDLNWTKHEKYITETILEKGDVTDVHWLFTRKSKKELRQSLRTLKLNPKSKSFWKIYFT